ncbi:GTPase, partial [Streptomyces sp. NPDC005180]|uniref:GTPase n=1 Tax=Streptomyces sp. NPDC005180 TaxID=3156868 RepID=UPI00339EE3FB
MSRMSVHTPGSEAPHRAGFACFVGRPNAGKSTLTNALVGQKVAITSKKPQTTRHTVRGIVHRPDLNAQLVLVDTPGLHKPRTLLGERPSAIRRRWSCSPNWRGTRRRSTARSGSPGTPTCATAAGTRRPGPRSPRCGTPSTGSAAGTAA